MIKDFIDKYLFWIKLLGFAVILLAIWFVYHRIHEDGVIAGKAEIQNLWDKANEQAAIDQVSQEQLARLDERKKVLDANKTDANHLKELQDENNNLQSDLNTERAINHRMRTVKGQAIDPSNSFGVSGTSTSPGITYTECEARLPAEIGSAFERLRESIIRIGSEANSTAITLGKAQEQLINDRK